MFHLPGRGTTALTVKSSPPKTAQTATRLGVRAGVLTKRDDGAAPLRGGALRFDIAKRL